MFCVLSQHLITNLKNKTISRVFVSYDAFIQGLDYVIFALYDGHGGNGTSLKLAKELHLVIHQVIVIHQLLPSIRYSSFIIYSSPFRYFLFIIICPF
jgi:hypothetical protein